MEEYNTIIIGSGIAGMSAAIYLRRAGIKTMIIESNMPGGQLNYASVIENYPGCEGITGTDLAMNIFNQLNKYNPDYLYEEVLEVNFEKNIVITDNQKLKYKYLIIASGRRNRMLGLEHEDKLIGNGISFCASCDGVLYKNKVVAVVGGANTAISEVLYLANICKKVYLIYRKDELRGEEILKNRLNDYNNIDVIYNCNVVSYIVTKDKLSGILLDTNEKLDINCLFLAIGYVPNSEIYDVKKENGYILVDKNYKTNVDNVYACGDIIKKDLYQLVTSSSEGAIAASHIIYNN